MAVNKGPFMALLPLLDVSLMALPINRKSGAAPRVTAAILRNIGW